MELALHLKHPVPTEPPLVSPPEFSFRIFSSSCLRKQLPMIVPASQAVTFVSSETMAPTAPSRAGRTLRRISFAAFFLLGFVGKVSCRADEKSESKKVSEADARMILEIEINKPENSGRGYRRPYVAAWLVDKDGFPVRTLALWVQKTPPGPRWIPDLRQWNKDDRMRLLVDETNLVDAISGPTKSAGKYKVLWDGKDDLGQPLKEGKYTLQVEAAREHGTYQIIREPLELSAKAFEKTLEGNVEIKSVAVSFKGLPETRAESK